MNPGLRALARRGCRLLTVALALGLHAVQAKAPSDLRLALVIGNGAYAGDAALANPSNDARAMATALRGLGFTVVELHDATRAQLREAIAKAGSLLQGQQAVGMLYYAGHGMQLDWHNYMIPVDARLARSADLPEQAVDVDSVIEVFAKAGNRMNIVVLDACRDNPFAQAATAKGLAPLDAPPNTLLAYATAPGNVALDGGTDNAAAAGGTIAAGAAKARAGNGLYTGYLVEEIQSPAARIEDVFKRVRLKVRKDSGGRQIPWESTSLEEDFSFNADRVVVAAAARPADGERERRFAEERADWEKVKASRKPAELYAFLDRHPAGELSEAALAQLNALERPQVAPTPGKGQAATLAYDGPRFVVGDAYTFRVFDRYSERQIDEFKRTVVGVEGGIATVQVSNGSTLRYTQLSGTLSNDNGKTTISYDPPMESDPAEFQVGRKWEGQSAFVDRSGNRVTVRSTNKIVGIERITLPAGSFDTYVIDSSFSYSNGNYEEVRKWLDPRYGTSVRRDTTVRRGGAILRYERRELVAYSAPRS